MHGARWRGRLAQSLSRSSYELERRDRRLRVSVRARSRARRAAEDSARFEGHRVDRDGRGHVAFGRRCRFDPDAPPRARGRWQEEEATPLPSDVKRRHPQADIEDDRSMIAERQSHSARDEHRELAGERTSNEEVIDTEESNERRPRVLSRVDETVGETRERLSVDRHTKTRRPKRIEIEVAGQ